MISCTRRANGALGIIRVVFFYRRLISRSATAKDVSIFIFIFSKKQGALTPRLKLVSPLTGDMMSLSGQGGCWLAGESLRGQGSKIFLRGLAPYSATLGSGHFKYIVYKVIRIRIKIIRGSLLTRN